MPLVFGGLRIALPKTLTKSETRRIKAECRVAFSLDIFFSTAWMQEVEQCRSNCRGQAKKSYSAAGPRPDI
ncbi:hypothetical protein BJL95_06940 [Methylomonas sp. LWB]|nr:hypothetical protein BJL95_06940 [Methylomonas sp. LWB]